MNAIIERLTELLRVYGSGTGGGPKPHAMVLNDSDWPDIEKLVYPQFHDVPNAFVVLVLGYWGKGRTVTEAANACRSAGAKPSETVVVRLLTGVSGVSDEAYASIHVDVGGAINYQSGIVCVRIVSPADGHRVTLGSLIPKSKKS